MPLGLLDSNSAPPAVRRPIFEVKFGGGSGGGLGSLASAAAGALGGDAQDPWQNSVISLTVETALSPTVDSAVIYLSADSQAPTVAIDDKGSISLGYEDSDKTAVFNGAIESVARRVEGITRLTATNAGAKLAALRVDQAYDGQKAGDIINDLAQRAEVDTDQVEDGVEFSYYVIDSRSPAYQHIAQLALISNLAAWITPEGKLNFAPYSTGSPAQTFHYGDDILAIEMSEKAPTVQSVKAVGEGAAGSKGKDNWNVLIKDPSSVTGQSGGGKLERLLENGALRSAEAASTAAKGFTQAALLGKTTGVLTTAGAPAVSVGSTIEVKDAPQAEMNGTFLVRTVRHQYSKTEGFITRIGICKFEEASGGLAGAPGGLL